MFKKMSVAAVGVIFVCMLAACDYAGKLENAAGYYKEGEYDKAAAIYSAIIKKNPKEIKALKGLADIKLAQKDYTAAINLYKQVVEINPSLAVKDLVSLLMYSDSTIRSQAVAALSSLSNGTTEAVNEILSQTANANQYVKVDFLEAVKKIGAPASFAAKDVIGYLDFDYPQVRQKALEVLSVMNAGNVKEAGGFAKMTERINDADPAVAETAVNSIAAFKSGAADMVPSLVKVFANPDDKLVAAAKAALAAVGPASGQATPELIELTAPSKNKSVRMASLDALAAMGPSANTTPPDLIPLMADPDNDVRVAAVSALSKIGKPSPEAVPAMIKLLKNKNSVIKLRAIAELGDMGKAAMPAIAALDQMKQDPDAAVRADAKKAAENILNAKI